jgi:xanthine dehydrogenase accessory factor
MPTGVTGTLAPLAPPVRQLPSGVVSSSRDISMTPEILAALEQAKRDKHPVVLATRLPSGEQSLLPHPDAPATLNDAAQKALDRDVSGTVRIEGTDWFLHAYNPPLRLIVVGAVHIAQALVPFAVPCGFAVTIVDPRRSFASDERFPGVEISSDWPDEALDRLEPDSRTAVVTLTHDPKLDDPALDRALKSQAFYIGALGSRRTHAARLKRLRELGHQDNALQRIHGPVGLNIEAVTAPEIALAVMAEIVGVRRNAPLPPKPAS